MNKGKRGFYKPFTNARLDINLQDWLKNEKEKYESWNIFFEELRRRYNENKNYKK